jgi:hypothetical protein
VQLEVGSYPAQQLLKFGETSVEFNRYNAQNDMDDDIEEVNMVHADDADLLPINFEIFSESSDCIIAETYLTPQEDVMFHELTQFKEATITYNLHTITTTSRDFPYCHTLYKLRQKNQFSYPGIGEAIMKMTS